MPKKPANVKVLNAKVHRFSNKVTQRLKIGDENGLYIFFEDLGIV